MTVTAMIAVTFVAPPPGLAPYVDFELEAIADADGLYSLRARETTDLRLFVVDADLYLPNYNPTVTLEQLSAIGATEPGEVRVLVVTSLGEDGPTANLMAPIYFNEGSGRAEQVILDGDGWPLRAPLGV